MPSGAGREKLQQSSTAVTAFNRSIGSAPEEDQLAKRRLAPTLRIQTPTCGESCGRRLACHSLIHIYCDRLCEEQQGGLNPKVTSAGSAVKPGVAWGIPSGAPQFLLEHCRFIC
jgi:hypothetical protein